VNIPDQGAHSVLYVATEHATVYAFDASNGQELWHVSLLGTGESTSDSRDCDEAVSPEIGITATPVIDRARVLMAQFMWWPCRETHQAIIFSDCTHWTLLAAPNCLEGRRTSPRRIRAQATTALEAP